MLTPSSHFIGAKDVFSGSIYSGASELGVLSRSKTALAYVNANVRILIEVRYFLYFQNGECEKSKTNKER